jgi:CHAD domain-containing protein
MATHHQEIERKYEVAPDVPLSGLEALPGVTQVRTAHHDLRATYFDTPDLALLRAGATLRARTGGTDAGWHLKVPFGGDRLEIAEELASGGPAEAADVPESLRRRARAWLRDAELQAVAILHSDRTVHELLAPDGSPVVEVADDVVTATVLAAAPGEPATVTTWREWEVEVSGDPEVGSAPSLLAETGRLLTSLGAAPAGRAAKLERALGDRLPAPRPDFGQLAPKDSGGLVLQAHLTGQVDALLAQDPRVRADEPDSIHKMRVATRRLRSALQTFRPLLDRQVTDPLRAELKWLAGELGVARDAEVQRDHFLELVHAEPPELVLGPVAATLQREWTLTYRDAHDEVLRVLDGERYFRLLDGLEALVARPPFTADADRQAAKVLTKRVARSYGQLAELVDAIAATDDPQERDHRYHEARKAAKRLRYAGEALTPAFGDDAATLAEAAEDVQEVLGVHQDSVVARASLREMALRAFGRGENTFSYGRLHALEQARAEQAELDFPMVWEAATAKRLRRWLRHA